ncbi:hypothetical protein [Clostridium sp.]|uniref:hypothetical protein n=1 Tax=Clostridium sp. TaxID=1506 RepID=UPI003F3422E0
MDNSMKALIMGAGVVITLAVITIGFIILNQGQNTAKLAVSKVDKINTNILESEYTVYEGMEVSGNEVVSLISKFKNDPVTIEVVTKKSTTEYNNGASGTASDTTDPKSNKYINPSGKFKGSVTRDANDVIDRLTFTQQ